MAGATAPCLEAGAESPIPALQLRAWLTTGEAGEGGLRPDAEVRARDVYGRTPLHWAVMSGDPGVAAPLVRPEDVDVGDWEGRAALHWAAARNDAPMVALLVDKGASVEVRDCEERTPLQVAAASNGAAATEALLHAGALTEACDWPGQTPLHAAARANAFEAASVLVARDADVNACTAQYELVPLHLAVWCAEPSFELVRLLLCGGARADDPETDFGMTMLHQAAQWNDLGLAELLLSHGAALDQGTTMVGRRCTMRRSGMRGRSRGCCSPAGWTRVWSVWRRGAASGGPRRMLRRKKAVPRRWSCCGTPSATRAGRLPRTVGNFGSLRCA